MWCTLTLVLKIHKTCAIVPARASLSSSLFFFRCLISKSFSLRSLKRRPFSSFSSLSWSRSVWFSCCNSLWNVFKRINKPFLERVSIWGLTFQPRYSKTYLSFSVWIPCLNKSKSSWESLPLELSSSISFFLVSFLLSWCPFQFLPCSMSCHLRWQENKNFHKNFANITSFLDFALSN